MLQLKQKKIQLKERDTKVFTLFLFMYFIEIMGGKRPPGVAQFYCTKVGLPVSLNADICAFVFINDLSSY